MFNFIDDEESSDIVTAPMGKLHLKTAEAIYLNGGKLTFNTKSRKARFYVNCFSEKSDLKAYNSQKLCCSGSGIVKVSSTQKLCTFDDPTVQVKGEVRFMSKNFTPMNFFVQSILLPQLLLGSGAVENMSVVF